MTPHGKHVRTRSAREYLTDTLRVVLPVPAAIAVGMGLAALSPSYPSSTPTATLSLTGPALPLTSHPPARPAPLAVMNIPRAPRASRATPPTTRYGIEVSALVRSSGPGGKSAREAVSLIHQYFPRAQWPKAQSVAACESTLRWWAVNVNSNGTADRGLFQLNSGGTEQELLSLTGQAKDDLGLAYHPAWNVRAAALLWRRDGWSRWTCNKKT